MVYKIAWANLQIWSELLSQLPLPNIQKYFEHARFTKKSFEIYQMHIF